MLSGGGSSEPAGEPDDFLLADPRDFQPSPDGLGGSQIVRPSDDYGDAFYGLVMDGKGGPIAWVPEGGELLLEGTFDPNKTTHSFYIQCLGDWDEWGDIEPADSEEDFVAGRALGLRVRFPAVYEILGAYGDTEQLSAIELTGLERLKNCKRVAGQPQLGELTVELTNSGSVRTLTYSLDGQAICSGSRTGDGAIELRELNSSGVNGRTTVTYTADIALADECVVRAAWAKRYDIHVAPVADWPLSFPRTAEATVYDPGFGANFQAVVDGLTSGTTYQGLVRSITDRATESANTDATFTRKMPGRPEAPGQVLLQSSAGDYTNTKIQSAESATAGVSYRVYDSELDDAPDFNRPITPASLSTSGGNVLVTLPALAASPANGSKRRVVIVAVASNGVEDATRRSITIEYQSGSPIQPRPAVPGFALKSRDGRSITIQATYDHGLSDGVAVGLIPRVYTEDGGSFYTATATPLTQSTGIEVKELEVTVAADGFFTFIVVAKATGFLGASSPNTAREGPVWLGTGVPAAPAGVVAEEIA